MLNEKNKRHVNIVVVSGKDGKGSFSPFLRYDRHEGEDFWLAGTKLRVDQSNRVRIPAKLMKEIVAKGIGVLREDGRYAIALQVRYRTDNHQLVIAGEPRFSDKIKPYLDLKNGSPIPEQAMRDDGDESWKRLRPFDYKETY